VSVGKKEVMNIAYKIGAIMENLEENVYTGKTTEEAIELGLSQLSISREEAEITVLEEAKKKLFGGVKARVKITKKVSDGKRAAEFVDGLLSILKIKAFSEIVADDDRIEINIQTTNSHQIIGRHGEVLDAIQTIAGAVANIGNEEYKKVVVDCENYREGREKTLIELANKLAKKAVEKGRKVTLEPMNPYERRIIHSALADSTEVKTASDGKEPNRFVVIIPNNLKPYERNNDRGERKGNFRGNDRGERKGNFRGDRKNNFRGDRDRRNGNGGQSNRPSASARPTARPKKEIRFGTYLGNSGNTTNNNNGGENS
jgi:spoIIIJ-associated protein